MKPNVENQMAHRANGDEVHFVIVAVVIVDMVYFQVSASPCSWEQLRGTCESTILTRVVVSAQDSLSNSDEGIVSICSIWIIPAGDCCLDAGY